MRTKIDVTDFDAETLIREINNKTNVEYNEQLERQYNDLNNVEKYVVDHFELFIRDEGMKAEDVTADGYKTGGIGKKLTQICDMHRRTEDGKRVKFYVLKPCTQICDLWAIIKYHHYGNDVAKKLIADFEAKKPEAKKPEAKPEN